MFFCRLCTISCDHFFVVTHQTCGKTLAVWITEFTGIEIREMDELPQLVCQECLDELSRFIQFRKKCLESDEFWRNKNEADRRAIQQTMKQEIIIEADDESFVDQESEENLDSEESVDNQDTDEILGGQKIEENVEHQETEENTMEPEIVELYTDEFVIDDYCEEREVVGIEEAELIEEHMEVEEETIDVVEDDHQECLVEEYLENEEEIEEHEVIQEFSNFNSHISDGSIPCCGCGNLFPSEEALMRHAEIHLEDHKSTVSTKSFECEVCHRKFITMKRLEEHHQDRMENKLKCPICHTMMSCSKNMANHMNTAHSDQQREIKCHVCGKQLRSKATLKKHLEIHDPNRKAEFPCDICGQKFYEKSEVSRHRLIHTGHKPHKCSYCTKSFRTKWEMKVHSDTHYKVPGVHKCRYCAIVFSDLDMRKEHEEENHKIACNFCSKTFGRKSKLVVHMRKAHTHEKPFKCYQCEKEFACSPDLKKHVQKMHREDWKCAVCMKVLSSSGSLAKHMRTHDPNRTADFVCEWCEARFYEKSELVRHWMIHTGEKPVKCDQCDKSFKRRWELKVHMQVHNRRPDVFKCHFCRLHFDNAEERREHENQNHKKICDYCGKLFGRKPELATHMLKNHAKFKNFECQHCCRTEFSTESGLRNHMKKFHL